MKWFTRMPTAWRVMGFCRWLKVHREGPRKGHILPLRGTQSALRLTPGGEICIGRMLVYAAAYEPYAENLTDLRLGYLTPRDVADLEKTRYGKSRAIASR